MGFLGYLYWTHSRSKQSRAKASNPLSSMGLTGAHFLDNSDGLDHYSSRIRSRLGMERPTVAHFGFSVTPVHIRAATGFSRMNLNDRLEAEITISRYDAAHASLRLPANLTPYSSSSRSKAVCVLPAPPVLEWFQCH